MLFGQHLLPEGWYVAAGLIGVALALAAFWVYNRDTSKINTGTWVILATGDSLDFVSYVGVTEEWEKNLIPAAFAVGSFLTFGYALWKRRFAWPDRIDWFFVGFDAAVTAYWICRATAIDANLLYQVSTVLAFVPMFRGLVSGREQEQALPWMLWSGAFLIFFLSALSQERTWENVVYPGVCLLIHLTIAGIAAIKARR